MRSLQSTEHMLNYGMYQMADETGAPMHYLIDTVDRSRSSSNSGENNLLRSSVDTNRLHKSKRTSAPTSNTMYASQRTSLFEEFVDQNLTNFSQSEFDKSISLIEFTIES